MPCQPCKREDSSKKVHQKGSKRVRHECFIGVVGSQSVEKGFSQSSSLSLAQSSTSRLVVTQVLLGGESRIAGVAVVVMQGLCRQKSSRSVTARNVWFLQRRSHTNRNYFIASEQFVEYTEESLVNHKYRNTLGLEIT